MNVFNQMDVCRLCMSENIVMFRISEVISDNLTYFEFSHQIADLPLPLELNKHIIDAQLICESCKRFCQEVLNFRLMISKNLECFQQQILIKEFDEEGEEEIEYEIETLNNPIQAMIGNICDETEDLIEETILNIKEERKETTEFPDDDEKYFQETITKIEKYICPIKSCKETFSSKRALNRHGVKMHSDLFVWTGETDFDSIVCIICGSQFQTRTELCEHKKYHKTDIQEKSAIKCRYCQKPYKSLINLTNHLKNHDEAKHFLCLLCKERFSDFGQEIQDHILIHQGSTPHICICGKTFKNAAEIKIHMRTHHSSHSSDDSKKEFLCFECGKAFSKKANLTQHLVRHRGYKKYPCDRCPAKFSSNGNLKAHKKCHLDEKPFKCEMCGSAFKQNYSLAKHIKVIHAGERNFQCEYCDMKFHSSDHLKRHTRTHTGEKPYNCEYCDKRFTQNGDLNKHKRVHLGENTYKCEEIGCEKSFRLRKDLRNHYYEHINKI